MTCLILFLPLISSSCAKTLMRHTSILKSNWQAPVSTHLGAVCFSRGLKAPQVLWWKLSLPLSYNAFFFSFPAVKLIPLYIWGMSFSKHEALIRYNGYYPFFLISVINIRNRWFPVANWSVWKYVLLDLSFAKIALTSSPSEKITS